MNVKFDASLDFGRVGSTLDDLGLQDAGPVQRFVDSEVVRLCDPKVPFRTGALKNSALYATVIGSGEVVYATPYAARMYYNPQYRFNEAPERGAYWAERMWSESGDDIARGAEMIAAQAQEGKS